MRVTAIFLLSIGFCSTLWGQSFTLNVLKKADQAFEEFSYAEAVTFYKLALPKMESLLYVTSQIARSYRNLNELDSAEVWLKRAIDLGDKEPETYFFLAEALLSNQKYQEAKYWYESYQMVAADDDRSGRKLVALDDFERFFSGKDQIEVQALQENSPGLDFAPAYYRNGLLFVSSRPKGGWINREFNWDTSNFLDYYIIPDSAETTTYLETELNTKYHEGSAILYNSNNSIAFTRNNYEERKLIKDDKGVTNLKIYFAEWDSDQEDWINEISFDHNSDEYSVGAPAISEDGKLLVFSSDMSGGFGASDLYYSIKQENGAWTDPVNLGKEVNTKGREGFPFLADDELYFASDGREGLGGLDLYKIKFNERKIHGEAVNLGTPFNSNRDDFGLIRKGDEGYFASNRNKETSDDIFSFKIKKPELILISGQVYDYDANTPIYKSDVFFTDKKETYLYTRSLLDGSFEIKAPINSHWIVTAGKYDYKLVDSLQLSLYLSDTLLTKRIYLQKLVEPQYDSLDELDAIPIVDNRIKPYNETSNFVDEFLIGDTLKLDNVYFDLDSDALRIRSENLLNKAAIFMIEHVDVKIILASHTDARSNHRYNELLSQRRSNQVTNYLIEMGVDPDRIFAFHYGEKLLINDCADGTDCHEDDHQKNRRTEIIFVKQETEG